MWEQIEFALRASLARVLTKVATLLPAVLSLVLTVLVCGLIGLLLAYLLRRILIAVRFDERVKANSSAGILHWSPVQGPTLILSRLVFWSGIFLGLVLGIAAFGAAYSASEQTTAEIYPYLTRLVVGVLLLLAGTVVARSLARSVLIGAVNMNLQYARLLSQGIKWLVLVLTVAMVLDHIGIGGAIVELAFGILFGGIVLALSLAIGLGSKDIVSRSLEQDGSKHTDDTASHTISHF
ncbi:MAG TPA: hypothetical protein VHT28_11495 [Silvibacterium sp.]|nr:hypothetical protein [Silvibacterium sp.]